MRDVLDDEANNNPALNSVAWHTCRKMIIVPRSAQKGFPVGHWPIPEAFWPDLQSQTLVRKVKSVFFPLLLRIRRSPKCDFDALTVSVLCVSLTRVRT